MGIREDMFAVQQRRRWSNTLDNDENGPDGGSRQWPNDVMYALAKRAIRMPGTVRVDVRQLDGGTESKQNCEQGDEQNASQRTRPSYFVAQHHS